MTTPSAPAEIQKSTGISKKFNYTKGSVHLNFSLNLSQGDEVKDFLQLLSEAMKDVEQELQAQPKPE